MRKIFFALLSVSAFLIAIPAMAQSSYTITGQIIDQSTGSPLRAASVVAQNTTMGTLSDSSGFFSLRLPDGGYTISISYTGYVPADFRVNGSMVISDTVLALAPEIKSMDEVSIALDLEIKDGFERYGSLFVSRFIGQTTLSQNCIIRNPQDLHFYFYKPRNTLKVITRGKPLVVDNFALGYTLEFSIDSFTNNFNTHASAFIGYPVFKEMMGTGEQMETWKKNRLLAYNGSMLQFMRSLYVKDLKQDGYDLKFIFRTSSEEIPITVKDFYGALDYQKDTLGTVHINPLQKEVAIIYNQGPDRAYFQVDSNANRRTQISTLIFDPAEPISIDRNGYYFPQSEIITNGYLGFKKVADMLPYDYQPFPLADEEDSPEAGSPDN